MTYPHLETATPVLLDNGQYVQGDVCYFIEPHIVAALGDDVPAHQGIGESPRNRSLRSSTMNGTRSAYPPPSPRSVLSKYKTHPSQNLPLVSPFPDRTLCVDSFR